MLSWSGKHGVATEFLLSALEFCRGLRRQLMMPVPCATGLLMEFCSSSTKAAAVCRDANRPRASDNLASCLATSWRARHAPIHHSFCKEIVEPTPPQASTRRPPCHELGFCLCGPAGDNAAKARRLFLSEMKSVFRPKSKNKDLLKGCHIFARLHGQRAAVDDPWAAADIAEPGSHASAKEEVHYWHVSWMMFSPYSPTFMNMKFVSVDDSQQPLEYNLEVSDYAGLGFMV